MSSTKGWPAHPSDARRRDRALDSGTEVYVLPGHAVRRWRGKVVSDSPHSGLCVVQPCEPGVGWSESPVTVRRGLVKRVHVRLVEPCSIDARLPVEFGTVER